MRYFMYVILLKSSVSVLISISFW